MTPLTDPQREKLLSEATDKSPTDKENAGSDL